MSTATTYADAGVNIDAGTEAVHRMKEHIRSTFNSSVLADVGSFGGMFLPNLAGLTEPVLVSSIDGVGTKLKVAQLAGRHDTVGRDLVWHCVNDILVQGAKPLFFLDYFATGKLDPSVASDVVKGLAEGCRAVGCALVGGETAEMPGLYHGEDYDVAGCIVGIVERSKIVTGSTISAGDALIGLASDGLHTNGFSLARHVLFDKAGYTVDSVVESLGTTVGDALLTPHRCYANAVLPLLDRFEIKGMAHLTGGGFYDNIPRILPSDCMAVVDRRAWQPLPIFTLIQEAGGVPEPEMFRTFNMGVGMVLVVPREDAQEIVAALIDSGEQAVVIGEVLRGGHEVQIV